MLLSRINFNISERKILLRVLDLVSILAILYFVSAIFDFDYFTITKENWRWLFVLIIYISVFGSVFELYDLQKSSKIENITSSIFLTVSVTVLFYLLTPFYTPLLPSNRLQILYFYFAILFALFIWRLVYSTFIVSPRFYKNVLIVGEISNIESVIKSFEKSDPNYNIVGFVNSDKVKGDTIKFKALPEYKHEEVYEVIKAKNISEIVIASYHTDLINSDIYNILINLLNEGFSVKEYAQIYEEMAKRIPIQFIGKDFYKYFPFSRSNHNALYQFFHRLFDLIFAVVGIFIGFLFSPIVLVGNVIGNRGPLFYTQERVGKNGQVFNIIKLRTMVKNAEASGGAVWAKKNDVRITTFGKFLRRSRLDEIPQFFNIFKGEMSLIGPRPERPIFVKELSETLPFYDTRHIIKPGLTGWAQVKAKYGSSIDHTLVKLQYDLYYIKHRSFLLDAIILIKTLSTVIFFRGQ